MSDSIAVIASRDLAARGHAVTMTWRIWLRGGRTSLHLLRSLVFLALLYPTMIPMVAAAMLWISFLNPGIGLFNYYTSFLGVPRIEWLYDRHWALPAIMIMRRARACVIVPGAGLSSLRAASCLSWLLSVVLGLLSLSGSGVAASSKGDEVRFLAVQGHRGASALAPENTLAAFRKALELGADGMEMDLQLTRDGAVVVIHDDTLERTTDGRGRVTDLTLAEVKLADAGVKFGLAYRGERVPTLTEIIDLVKASGNDRVGLNLEIKFGQGRAGQPGDVEERVLAVLRATGFVGRVTVQSFHHPSPVKLKALEPRIPIGLLVGARQPSPDPVALVREYRADYYAPEHRLVTPELVRALHQAGMPVVTWTVNEEPLMRRLIEAGLGSLRGDAIISDYPDRAVNLRRTLSEA